MAPVGRWQKNKDLSWYAKGDDDQTSRDAATEARREEIRKVKEAEREAMGVALGWEPAAGAGGGGKGGAGGANGVPLGERKGVGGADGAGKGEGGTPEERAVRRIVEEERARDGDRDGDREKKRRRRDEYDGRDGYHEQHGYGWHERYEHGHGCAVFLS